MNDAPCAAHENAPWPVIREGFARTLRLIVTRPGVLWTFYRNILLLIGLLIGIVVIGGLALAGASSSLSSGVLPKVAACVGLVLVLFCAWYLSASALGAVILVAVESWNGKKVRVREARRLIGPRIRSAMFADVLTAVGMAILLLLVLVCASAPVLLKRYALATHAAPVVLPLWEELTIALPASCVTSILAAYTALALRHVVFSEAAAKKALFCAHQEIVAHPAFYRNAMLVVGLLGAVVSLLTYAANMSISASNAIESASAVPGFEAIGLSLLAMALVLFQTLPYVWIAERFHPSVVPGADPAILASPPARGFSFWVGRFIGIGATLGFIAIAVVIAILVAISIVRRNVSPVFSVRMPISEIVNERFVRG